MFAWVRRLSGERWRTWSLLSGLLVGATIVKVGTFSYVRQIFHSDSIQTSQDAFNQLQQAREYAHEAAIERQKKLPQLTAEQEEQMKEYLKLVNQHGLSKLSEMESDPKNCQGCPLLSRFPLRPPQSSSSSS